MASLKASQPLQCQKTVSNIPLRHASRVSMTRHPLRVTATSTTEDIPTTSTSSSPVTFDFACPICHTTEFKLQSVKGKPMGSLACPRCSRTFASAPTFLDLTLTSGIQQKAYNQKLWGGTQIFRNPLVSLAYERGWRQSFAWAGFPGVDKEFEMAMERLQPAHGQVIVDMSCGSGLFSRRFLSSGKFAGVVAADFSESMLKEAKQYFDQDSSLDTDRYMLARMDVARQPFPTGSVSAIHAGAAIHCWPDPQAALAEISRVLKPGGVFVASTFLKPIAPLGQVLGDDAVRPLEQLIDGVSMANMSQSMRWWDEGELRELCEAVGLQGFTRERTFRFILFSVTKPKA